jgi:nucleoid-associated protein YgaU
MRPDSAATHGPKGITMSEKYEVVKGETLWGLAQRFYGDGRLFPVIAVINHLADPDTVTIGQKLEIPYVTYRHQVVAGDTKRKLAQRYYHDETLSEVFEIPNGAAQRDLIVGEWLVIPDVLNPGHHTVAAGETLKRLADRFYGDEYLWSIIAIANHMADEELRPGQVLIRPRLNRRRTVVGGDTLWKLVTDNYGDYGNDRTQTLVALVAAANHIGDPDHIEVGQIIYFPSLD